MFSGNAGTALPEVLALPLDVQDPQSLAAAHLLLTEVERFSDPTYTSSHQQAAELIEKAQEYRPGRAALYALLDPATQQVIAAADVRHHQVESDRPHETYSYVNKVAVNPAMRRNGLARKILEHVDREAQRRGDACIRLCALVPEVFSACGFTRINADNELDGRMVALVGAVAGLQAA